jgi:hypothetical protein
VFSLPRLLRRTDLAVRAAYLYWIEFSDYDGTTFQKIGISTTEDRLYRHTVLSAGTLLGRADDTLLVCCQAEQLVVQHVRERSYRPAMGRIRGGDTECFRPGDPLDLPGWIHKARTTLFEAKHWRPIPT